jgi:DNA-binding MarR family transcriptional regulator
MALRILTVLPPMARALASEVRKAGADDQLTLAQFSALRLLADHGCSVGEMARTLHVTMPTATQLVDGLAGKGLATRVNDEQDRRQVRLAITDAGRRVLERCLRAVEAYLAEALLSWPEERQRQVAGELEELLALVRAAAEAQRV